MSPPTTPVLFVGHGSPMNAIEDNRWSRAQRELGAALAHDHGTPRGIVAISAHWLTEGTWLTGNQHPPTIHDFGGFPEALYRERYPAPGDAELALDVARLLDRDERALRSDWGLDHGTWTVLKHLRPTADVPVVQLSLNLDAAAARHLELGARLRPLREQGVWIVASGNVTHNLRDALARMQRGDSQRVPWAEDFDAAVVRALRQRDGASLAQLPETPQGRLAHPTPDHWLPLLYAFGASREDDEVTFPVEGFDFGSLSMRAVLWTPRSGRPAG